MQTRITKFFCNISRCQNVKNQNNLSQNIIYSILEGLIEVPLVKIHILMFEKSKFD